MADWLRDNLLDDRFALQVFDSNLDDQDIEFLMEASRGFRDTYRPGINMSDDEADSIVDMLCDLDASTASLRTAVEQAESEPGLRLRALLRLRDDDFDAACEGLREWFGFL